MGYWAGRENQRFYIEGGVVLSGPQGAPLSIDPVTFEPLSQTPKAPPVFESESSDVKNVLNDYTDENKVEAFLKEGRNVKPIEHAKECRTQGRGGKYTESCPKCEFLRKK